MLAARTDKQKDSQDAYMEKLQDILNKLEFIISDVTIAI